MLACGEGVLNAQPVDKDTNVPVKDCISRQAAIDAIKNVDVVVLYHDGEPIDEAIEEAIEAVKRSVVASVENLSSAQPEIIRCGECSYFKSSTSIYGECMCHDMWQSLYGDTPEVDAIVVHKDHYCGYAERRADE